MITLFPSRTVALDLLGFQVHWYGVMYLLAFLLAWHLLPRLQKFRDLELSADEWSRILSYAIIGVIVGGRLGFVLFYEPEYFLRYPGEIVAIWRGGMSSHGGFLGVIVALMFALKERKNTLWKIADIAVVPAALGLALGRVGNIINQELYGIPTGLPFGVEIPDVEGLRHPTHLYAVLKDLFITAICYLHLRNTAKLPVLSRRDGATFELFLILYAVLRFFLEYLRDQEYPLLDTGVLLLSRGQILTLLLLLFVLILRWRRA